MYRYLIRFTLVVVAGKISFPAERTFKTRLAWTEENKPLIKKLAEAELDYMFESWKDMDVEPVVPLKI